MRAWLRRVRREERGDLSITGTLMAIVVFTGVLGATLTTFQSFARDRTALEQRNGAQDGARTAIDRVARELRNLASPTTYQPQAFDAAGPYDVVFKTVDRNGPNAGLNAPNIKRVRYCLTSTDPQAASLMAQTQTWTTQEPPAVPSTTACPGTGWNSTETVAVGLSNRRSGQERPVFTFNSATLTDITTIHLELHVDDDGAGASEETTISSGVYLRNQNRKPTASFTATPSAQGIVLNGSASFDPEGEPLTYVWYDGTTKIGSGITFTYPATLGSSRTIQLKVYDPAVLEGVSAPQVVVA
ncbi:hypothetical protein [Paraconexibacter sp.]|uniref:hypothetical protein n=1 Tax=Paraconexibacter sp. TaxID=2949640 RepID=UPI0035698388